MATATARRRERRAKDAVLRADHALGSARESERERAGERASSAVCSSLPLGAAFRLRRQSCVESLCVIHRKRTKGRALRCVRQGQRAAAAHACLPLACCVRVVALTLLAVCRSRTRSAIAHGTANAAVRQSGAHGKGAAQQATARRTTAHSNRSAGRGNSRASMGKGGEKEGSMTETMRR